MTKIPSVEDTSRHFCNGIALQLKPSNAVMEAIRLLNKELPQALTAERLALLTELRDSGLLEEHKGFKGKMRKVDEYYVDGYNTLAKAIKAHLDELIKSNSI